MTKEDVKELYDKKGSVDEIQRNTKERLEKIDLNLQQRKAQIKMGIPTPYGNKPHPNEKQLLDREDQIAKEKKQKVVSESRGQIKEEIARLHTEKELPEQYHPEHEDFPFNEDYGFEPNEAQKQKGMDEKAAIKENALNQIDERMRKRDAYQKQGQEITKDSPTRHYRESKESILQHLDKKQQSREGAKQVRVEDKTKEPDK